MSTQLEKISKLQQEAEVAPDAIEKDTQRKKQAAKLVQKFGLKTPQEIMAVANKSRSMIDEIRHDFFTAVKTAVPSFAKKIPKQKINQGSIHL